MKKVAAFLFCLLLTGSANLFAQTLDSGTGMTWGDTFPPGEPLVLNENFQGFSFFHSDSNPDQGNSNNLYDTSSGEIIYGYKNDTTEVPIIGSSSGKIKYYFYQCAFAPNWKAAWAYRDSVDNTANVSNGFVEVSRTYASDPPTIHGYFIVDLRALDFVEVMQWSHSSCGGNKRGVMVEFSIDNGDSWDTLRYQPGVAYSTSFSKDITTGAKTPNGYRCDPSAYGMTWEDGIYASNVMLRFEECGGQVPRIHDLKIFGDYIPPTATKKVQSDELKIYSYNKKIRISQEADVAVYNIDGVMVKSSPKASEVPMDDMPAGIYLVKVQNGVHVQTSKVLIK